MPRLRNICLALSLLTCAACSKGSEVASAPPAPAYQGIPPGLMPRCTAEDIPLKTAADIVTSRGINKEGGRGMRAYDRRYPRA